MAVYKKVLVILLCAFMVPVMFLLGGCSKISVSDDKKTDDKKEDNEMDVEFPLDEIGYPQNNVVIINNKSYPIEIADDSHIDSMVDSVIRIKMEEENDIVEVILPQYLPIAGWSIEEKEYINLISYSRIEFPIKDEHMLEGITSVVQKFQLQVAKDQTTEILLKWSNVNEIDKLFKDKKEYYLLKIVVSY